MLFDSHNHLQSSKFGEEPEKLIKEMQEAGISGCVVNATRESDWQAVRELAERFPGFVRPAYGIHPWFADTVEAGWEDRLRELLGEDEQASVGEVGVDGWVDSPEMDIQKPVFAAQVKIAAELERNMTVHCLKAWEPLFEVMNEAEEADAWPEKFLMHSFGGSIEVAERLMKREGVMFSFSGYFLQERKHKALEVFKQLPNNRILLETDAPEMMPPEKFVKFPLKEGRNHPANLGAIAEGFESELGEDILEQVAENSRAFWAL